MGKVGALTSKPCKDLMAKNLRLHFESQHVAHDAEAFSVSQLGDSLPEPRFVLGYSLSGTHIAYASSRSSDIERALLLAQFLGNTSPDFSDFLFSFCVLFHLALLLPSLARSFLQPFPVIQATVTLLSFSSALLILTSILLPNHARY